MMSGGGLEPHSPFGPADLSPFIGVLQDAAGACNVSLNTNIYMDLVSHTAPQKAARGVLRPVGSLARTNNSSVT